MWSGAIILLTNWSDGHNHIYLYQYEANHLNATTARLEKQLTSGDFEVTGILGVDWEHKRVCFSSNENNVLGQQLWQVDFDGKRKALTSGRAFTTAFSADTAAVLGGHLLDPHDSSPTQPLP